MIVIKNQTILKNKCIKLKNKLYKKKAKSMKPLFNTQKMNYL